MPDDKTCNGGPRRSAMKEEGDVQRWNLHSLDVQPHRPVVLDSHQEGRSIAIHLPAGERLQEHRVHERAWLVVIDGEIDIGTAGASERGIPGLVAIFDPRENHEI